MINNFLTVILVILPYFLVSWAIIGISVLIANRLWVDPVVNTSNVNQVNHITAEPKHYRKVA